MKDDDPQTILRQWRVRILNVFLGVVAVISLPAIGTIISSAVSEPEFRPIAIAFSVVELFLIALAVLRRLPINLRVGGLWLIGYTAAVLNLARTGLSGAGPLYLLVLPILILILVGKRASFFTAIFSGLLAIGCAILIEQGLLVPDLTARSQGMSLTTIIMFLTVVMTILILFYRLQERLIADERHAQAELLKAQALLEEQNLTLEQKVIERTRELQSSNLSLEQRNSELAIINKIQQALASKLDFQALIDLFGNEIMRIFPPDEERAQNYSALIAFYDPPTNMIRFPYLINGEGTHFTQPAMELGLGLTSTVIQSGEPLVLKTLDEQIAHGLVDYADERLQAKSQSWLGVPIRSGDRVMGVFSVEDPRPNLFTEADVRLLSTLAASLGVALEKARLFDETQRLLEETDQHAAELATVNTVSSAISSELDLDALINLVGEQIRSIFKADIVYVALLDRQNHIINFLYQYGDKHEPLPLGQGLTSKVIQGGEPLLINRDIEQRRKELGTKLVGKSVRSFLGVPVFVSGEAVGVISVQHATQEDAFNEKDQHLLSTIAANVGTALQNARLFEEIKRQEHKAHEMQRRLANIIDFLPDPTLVIDDEGKVIAWNRAIEEMTGISATQMLGNGNYEYALPFYGEQRPILIDLVLQPQDEIEAKYAHIHRDGNVLSGETYTPALQDGGRYLYATASALHDAAGNAVGAIEIIRDITERMHAQEELRKAKAEAEQANHAKSAFLANMSHELRTPLNAIIGFTRIVRRKGEDLLPEKQIENLDKVLTSADNLLSLINTVLDIAKIEAGRMDVLPANFRFSPLIDLCANTAQPLLRPTVMLEKQVDESITTLYSDQDKIRQIVLNLLSNAAKFTHSGKITLSAKQESENLHVTVSDTGIGISAEALPHIFKEFEQADIATTRKYGGTGLGLTISRNLARLLGGDLTVESEFGQGSTFTLVIPVHYEHDLSQVEATTPPAPDLQPFDQTPWPDRQGGQDKPAPVSEVAPHTEAGSAKKHILVIDDDPDAVYLLQENLDQGEFEVSGCRNGLDGLQLARKQQPQAILLDILMPGTDGWQILHELKNDPATAEIPVILHTIVDKKALGLQLGAAAYLLKPLDPVAVREALDRVIIQNGHKPKRVLVVDDDPNVTDMLRQFLPESDFSLESALDGQAGLRAIEAHPPDILLLDLLMPTLDGFGVIEHLRANPQVCDLPIIVISAKDLTAEESACLKETVAVVMKKQGFQGEKLIEEINHVLRRAA